MNDKLKKATVITAIIFAGILLLAFNLRRHTFHLPHYRGDQHHYIGLAFKVDAIGVRGYNLRGIKFSRKREHPYFWRFLLVDDKGQILEALEKEVGVTYYDEPLHHVPFAFPMALVVSHKIFAPQDHYYLLKLTNEREVIMSAPPGVGLRDFRFHPDIAGKQFYSIIVPLLFSFMLLILVYFLAKKLYNNEWIALVAMYLMAISPVDLLTSQKVWADDMTAALAVLAVFLYVLSVEKKSVLLALAGGVSCGLSAITKQNGAFVAFVIILWHFITNHESLLKRETFLKTVFDKNLILFGLGIIIGSGCWFYTVWSTYGTPFYRPHVPDIAKKSAIDWFRLVGERPWYVYLVGIPYQNPLFALAYISPLFLWLDKKNYKKTLLSIIWIAVFLYIFQEYLGTGGKEHRYMLPSYAAFAILGAYVANYFRVFLDKRLGARIGTALLIIALIVSAFWSIPIAFRTLFYNGALLMVPF
ncbi:MAG: glycosyltransferase family 39 protein [Candidatus Omnitrophota bacterium]